MRTFQRAYPSLLAVAVALVAMQPAQAIDGQTVAAPAPAADGQSTAITDIVVTATRRATNIQSVPLAITAIGGDTLAKAGISNPRDLSGLAPNLQIDQGYANGQTHASIRGVASTDFGVGSLSPVAMYIDDVYQAYQYGLGTQIFDLNRVEILRGPQGTLFGKNTTGGALAYYSKAPTDRTEGYVEGSVGGGDFTEYSAEGAYNTPLANDLNARVSMRFDRRDNYISNLADNSKLGHYGNFAGRLQLAWTPSATTRINLKLFGVYNRGDGPIYIGKYGAGACDPALGLDVYDACVNGSPTTQQSTGSHHTYSYNPSFENFDNAGATLRIEHDFGDWVLTAITGLEQGHYGIVTNDTGTTGDFFHSQQSSFTQQASQELRVATPVAAKLRGIFGVFASYDKIRADQNSGSTTLDIYNPAGFEQGYEYTAGSLVTQKTVSAAAFGSLTYDLTDKLSVIGGARYSFERRMSDLQDDSLFGVNPDGSIRNFQQSDLFFQNGLGYFPFAGATTSSLPYNVTQYTATTGDIYETGHASASFKKVTWDANVNYKVTSQAMLYAKVGTGFRSGYFPTFVTTPGTFGLVKPEAATSYEVGFKTEWFDRRLIINGDVYYTNYKDMQVQVPNPLGPGLIIGNAASAHLKGAELDMQVVPVRGLHIHGALGYSDAHYLKYSTTDSNGNTSDQGGHTLPYAPKWTASLGGDYEFALRNGFKLDYSTDWSYRTRIFFDPYNTIDVSDRAELTGNMQLSLSPGSQKWTATLFVNNVTNRLIKAFAYNQTYVTPTIYAPERTFGLRVSTKF